MFECSLMDLGAARQVRRRLVSLPAAVALHGLVIASVGFAQYWDVAEVADPAAVNVVFLTAAPPPPPAPSGGGRREPVPPRPEPAAAPPEVAQPQDVPDDQPAPAPTPEAPAPPAVVDLLGPATGGPSVPGSVGPGGFGDGPLPGPGRGDGVDPSVAPADDEPIQFRPGITRPEILERVEPHYTELDRRVRTQGVVVVEAVIDEQGRVRDVKILRGVSRGLDQATVDAIRRWRFRPATLDGRPVKIYYSLTVNFQVR